MNDLKTKSVLVYEYGTFLHVAQRLAKDFGRVMYYTPWKYTYPELRYALPGLGIPNIERVSNFFDRVDEADIIVFPDIMDADLQLYLESKGKKVWGSRRGEELEIDRDGIRKLMKELELPVPQYEVVVGMDNLRKYLKENNNIWVKVDCFRGDFETFQSKNYRYIETYLDDLERQFVSIKNHIRFVCEQNLDHQVELGYDGYNIDGQFPEKTICGLEVKDMGYVGIFKDYKDLPEPVINFNNKIAPILKEIGYKNMFSTELRIGKDHVGYMTDACCRFPSPPSELYTNMIDNFSEIIWEGAHGNCIDPICKHKYGVEVMISCNWAEKNWLPVQFTDKYADNIALKNCARIDGQYYVIPQRLELSEIGAISVTGDTLEDAVKNIEAISDDLRAFSLKIPMGSIENAKKEIEKLEKFGYNFFDNGEEAKDSGGK